MLSQFSSPDHPSVRRLPIKTPLAIASVLALALALSACGKRDETPSAGQQVDSAIAKTEQAATEAKAKAESSLAEAGAALKDTTQNVEAAGKDMASKAGAKIDDMAITTAIKAGLAKDADLSALAINVDTQNGAVVLNGSAPSEAARDKASTLAKGVQGVNSVDNKLVVKAAS